MKHPRIILIISSFAIAIASGFIFSAPETKAAELLPSLINTANAKEEAVHQTQDKTQDTLTPDERKAILQAIVSSSQDEIKNLRDALAGLQLDDAWSIARDRFLDTLATSSDYYKKIGERLDQKNIPLDEIKATATELKTWRETTYTPQSKEMGNLILVFQSENVHNVVQIRDTKISNDIKKLDRQKLVNTDTLKKYLSQAEKSIANAQVLNNKAKDLYYAVSVAPLQPKKNAATSTESSTEDAMVTPDIAPLPDIKEPKKDPQDEVRDLSKDSLKELKTAYELFFKMNDRIRK